MSGTALTLEERIDSAIHQDPHLSGHTLHIEMRPGRVVLHGVVRSYYLKQIAQEVVRSIDGVRQIDNRLEVAWVED
jgi:osmotically-inducible protein OsmY